MLLCYNPLVSILFKREFFEPIRRGRKTVTIRYWRPAHAGQFRPGRLINVPHLAGGLLEIQAVEPVAIEQLTEADASADGFESRDAMVARLREIYPAIGLDADSRRRLFRIRFAFIAQ